MSEREHIEILAARLYDAGYIVPGRAIDDALEQAGLTITPQAGEAEPAQTDRDWPDDFWMENGQYECSCSTCGNHFTGHKRRVTCRVCANRTAPPSLVCPHLRSSDEGTQWCDLAVAPVWQPKARVYAWLGYWRDKMPPEAVEKLQNILGPLNDSPGAEKP